MSLRTQIVSALLVAAWIGAVIAVGMGAARKADSAQEESLPGAAADPDVSYASLPLCIDRSEPDEPVVVLVVCR